MFTKKNTRRALLVSVMSLILCCAMLMGTTFAWFTDSVTSGGNIIKSGTLDVTLQWADGTKAVPAADSTEWTDASTGAIFNYTLWEPGFTQVRHLRIANAGTLAMKYQLKIVANGTVSDLSDVIDVYYTDPAVQVSNRAALTADKKLGTLTQALAAMPQTASGNLQAGEDVTLTLALKMQESAGNQYQNKSIGSDFSIVLVATQLASETDSFGSDYDGDSIYVEQPLNAVGSAVVDNTTTTRYEVKLYNAANTESGSVIVPVAAVDPAAEKIETSVKETLVDANFSVANNKEAVAYDINVTGLKTDNTTKVTVTFSVGKNLSNVQVYHYNAPMTEGTDYYYNPNTGYLEIYSATFSPFTVVFDANETYTPPTTEGAALPVAIVTKDTTGEYVGKDLEWGSYGQWSPTAGLDSTLEAAYTFACQDSAAEALASPYANWECDFFVKLDRDLGEDQIFLGGNYGGWGWIGFHNGNFTLEANKELALLGSVTNKPWTYYDVASNVGTFLCGVCDVNDALSDATFTVTLRLTDPVSRVTHDVAVITHTFN